jgi:Fungal specific transcription factor domain.
MGWNKKLIDRRRHQKYFDIFYPVLPILNQSRFRREWAQEPASPRIRGLSYAVALVGSMIAPEYAHLQSPCYSNARKYIELCERDDDETNIMSLNAFQALLFIIRYELTKKHFVRAWMTLGRAVTLAQILNLHHIDGVVQSGLLLPCTLGALVCVDATA